MKSIKIYLTYFIVICTASNAFGQEYKFLQQVPYEQMAGVLRDSLPKWDVEILENSIRITKTDSVFNVPVGRLRDSTDPCLYLSKVWFELHFDPRWSKEGIKNRKKHNKVIRDSIAAIEDFFYGKIDPKSIYTEKHNRLGKMMARMRSAPIKHTKRMSVLASQIKMNNFYGETEYYYDGHCKCLAPPCYSQVCFDPKARDIAIQIIKKWKID